MIKDTKHLRPRGKPPGKAAALAPPSDPSDQEVASRQVLIDLARKIQTSLMADNAPKPTFSEYFKILQLLKETEGDLPRDITIRWVDPLWSKEE